MTGWRPDFDPSSLYFVTTTAVQRAHIFQRDVIKRILVDGLYHALAVDHIKMHAFVIMPNHTHFIIQCPVNNPIQPHWHLAECAEDYIWSSARFYLLNEPALIPLTDARELF